MKLLLCVFRIRIINCLQYRAIALGSIMTRFVWGGMEILAFTTLFHSGVVKSTMDLSQTVSYIWMQQALYTLFLVVYGDNEIYSSINSGSISYELIRPTDLYKRWYLQSVSNRISSTLVYCLPVLLIALFMPNLYKMVLPNNTLQIVFFAVSTLLALGVVVAFAMLMYISMFYIISHRGVKIIVTAVTTFFSGGIIPLPFFPEHILNIIKALPFSAMQSMPLLIYSNSISGVWAIKGIIFQIIWLFVLVLFGKMMMNHALKKVVVQGG